MPFESHVNIALIPEPTSPDHLVPARWVTAFVQGLQKLPVRLVATQPQVGTFDLGDKEFTYTGQGPITVDGEEIEQDDRVLFTGQTGPNAVENLIYTCTHAGVAGTDETVLTLATDADDDSKFQTGVTVAVTDGDDNAGKTFRLTTQGTIILGSTALEWEPYTTPKGTARFAEEFDASTGTVTASGGMEWEITHPLGTDEVLVQLFDRGNQAMILANVEVTDTNTVTIGFDVEPAATDHFRAVIIG